MRRLVGMGLLLVFCFTLGCFSTRRYDEAHATRTAAIYREYDVMEAERRQSAQELIKSLDAFREFLVPVKAGSSYSPVVRVDAMDWFLQFRDMCLKFASDAKASTDPTLANKYEQISRECFAKLWKDQYVPWLKRTYYRADMAWVLQQWNDKADIEALFAYSHNTAILGEISAQRRDIELMLERQLVEIRALRDSAVANSAWQRDEEVADARAEYRSRMIALSNALGAMAQSSNPSSAGHTNLGTGCSSDFDCGVGGRCVKNNYSSTGYCAQAVNSYGNPTYGLPRLDSVYTKLPVSTDCKLFTDCPIGFRCDLQSGACLK